MTPELVGSILMASTMREESNGFYGEGEIGQRQIAAIHAKDKSGQPDIEAQKALAQRGLKIMDRLFGTRG